jgi:hypothetical protein
VQDARVATFLGRRKYNKKLKSKSLKQICLDYHEMKSILKLDLLLELIPNPKLGHEHNQSNQKKNVISFSPPQVGVNNPVHSPPQPIHRFPSASEALHHRRALAFPRCPRRRSPTPTPTAGQTPGRLPATPTHLHCPPDPTRSGPPADRRAPPAARLTCSQPEPRENGRVEGDFRRLFPLFFQFFLRGGEKKYAPPLEVVQVLSPSTAPLFSTSIRSLRSLLSPSAFPLRRRRLRRPLSPPPTHDRARKFPQRIGRDLCSAQSVVHGGK